MFSMKKKKLIVIVLFLFLPLAINFKWGFLLLFLFVVVFENIIISFCSCFWEKFLLCRPNLAINSLWPKLAWPGTHDPSMPASKDQDDRHVPQYLPKEDLKAWRQKKKKQTRKLLLTVISYLSSKKSSVFHFKENLETYTQKENIKLKA